MVKSTSKIFLILSLVIVGLLIECNIDLPGLIISNNLDERLLEKSTFNYLTAEKRNITCPDEFSFIVMADSHVENGDIEDLKKIEKAITPDVKFITNLGDISQYGAEEDIEKVMNFYSTLSVPCYPVIGNHDIYAHEGVCNWPVWKKKIGSTRYRVDGGSVTLFVLDSANAYIGKSQIDWLERELKTVEGTVFVLTHSDFFVQDKIKIQQIYDPAERARIMALLRNNNDKCKMLLTGHSHERVEKEFGDVKYISIEDYKSTQAYMLVKVKNGVVSYEFKNANDL
ncbi:metallophosphoesterase family protein [Treponema sp. R80B11-R83G3]